MSFVYFIRGLLDLWGSSVTFIMGLWPEEFLRVFWAFCFLEVPRYFLSDLYVLGLFLHGKVKQKHVPEPVSTHHQQWPLVSVVIPALNEAETIERTIQSLLEQTYPNLELVIVDDGSSDGTNELCQRFMAAGVVRYYRFFSHSQRQGKAAALNYGIKASRGDLLVFMDSDSTLDRDAILKLVEPFSDPAVGATCGDLRVRNPGVNLLTRLQAMEYITSMMVGRKFRAAAGILSVVPGAFGAFRRDLLARVGGHEPGPGNDSDLTIRTRKLGKKIVFADGAICLTNVPTRWGSWVRQRMRWDRNLVRNRLRRHRDVYNFTQAGFDWRTMLSFIDSLFFAQVLTFIWAFYVVNLFLTQPERPLTILFANFILHLALKLAQYTVALIMCERWREYLVLTLYIPLFGLYRIISKLVRIAATLQEFFLRWSYYRDPFAPPKVRKQMEVF